VDLEHSIALAHCTFCMTSKKAKQTCYIACFNLSRESMADIKITLHMFCCQKPHVGMRLQHGMFQGRKVPKGQNRQHR
jgi:hypothetical protein